MNTVIWMADGQKISPLSQSAAQMVADRPRRARVFEKWGLSYCCDSQPLNEACQTLGIDLQKVLADLKNSDLDGPSAPCETYNWASYPLSDHIDHIVDVHHTYLRRELPRVARLIDRVAADHGATFNELWEMQGLFEEFQEHILRHMNTEETNLFLLLKQLETTANREHLPIEFIQVLQSLCSQHLEHAEVRAALTKLREWTRQFTPPQSACNTYRVLLDGLEELEIELGRHMSEEEDILFPRALAIESQLVKS